MPGIDLATTKVIEEEESSEKKRPQHSVQNFKIEATPMGQNNIILKPPSHLLSSVASNTYMHKIDERSGHFT